MLTSKQLKRVAVSLPALSFAASMALSVGASPANAQEADDDDALDEIVVTSRYREERLQSTPIAITALTGDELEIRAFTNAYEVGYQVPNASMRPAQAAFGNTMTAYVRGIGQYDFDFAFEPGVGIYVDDLYHPFTMGSQIDLLDLERVEVLRGPQGTLFGRGAIGGAIRYVTKQPTGDGSGSVSLTVGDYDRVDVRASYDFALVEDKLFARVAGVSKSREGHQDVIDFACAFPEQSGNLNPRILNEGFGCKTGTQGGQDVTGGRAAIRWAVNDAVDLTFTAEFLDDNSEARADTLMNVADSAIDDFYKIFVLGAYLDIDFDDRFLPPNNYVSYATYDDSLSGLTVDPVTSFEKETLSATLDWDISDTMSAKVIASSTDITSKFATDADQSPLNMQTVDGFQTMEFNTFEVRLNGRAMDSLDWTVGGFIYDGFADTNQTVSIPWLSMFLDLFLPNPFGPSVLLGEITFEEAAELLITDTDTYTFVQADNDHDNRHESVYGHVVFDVNDRISLNAGLRYSSDEKVVAFDNTRVVNPRVVVEDDRVDWKIGVDFQFNEEMMLYGSAATGYRPGAYNPRPFQATQVVPVDAEEAISYELGFKGDFLDNKLRINAAAFLVDWKTRILPVGGTECPLLDLGPPPVYNTVDPDTEGAIQDSLGNWCLATVPRTFYENGPADIDGFEAEIFWRPTENLTINGQIGILNWDSPDIADLPPYVPEQNWSVGASYLIELAGGGSLMPRVDVYGQSEICSNSSQASCAPSYQLVNASVMWSGANDDWDVVFGVTNLTDEDYFLNIFDLTVFGQQTTEGQPGRPSEWFVTLRRHFD